ncbi:MAG: universal stress protein [Flavobacteriales bacterium]|nr:MAG: universal stress protein [Flavobacteriales bacterium]
MKHILVPTDFSINAWNAFEYARKRFEHVPCRFYVLHVASLADSPITANSLVLAKSENKSAKKDMRTLFERISRLAPNANHKFMALHQYGYFVDMVRKAIDEYNIELLVMGTKGADGIKASVIGSNTGDVIHKVRCDILIVPENAVFEPIREVAFPTDFNTFYTHHILESLSEILATGETKLRVVHVKAHKGQLSVNQEQNRVSLKDYLEELFREVHSFHMVTNTKVSKAIEEFTDLMGIDLVVMVAKNLNFLQQLLFDSSIQKVSFHTEVPLLVLHE